MKRFYAEVSIGADNGLLLDGKPVKTPGRALLIVPTTALAEAIADEWRAQGDRIDPRSMPLTGLANAAIDRVASDPAGFAEGLTVFAESDLLCYRAGDPESLITRQSAAWEPLLDWAEHRWDIHFIRVTGIVHQPQPPATLTRLRAAVAALDPFRLAALSPLVTIPGSLVIGLAVIEQAFDVETLWEAATIDECWQAEQWGEDDEAITRTTLRRAEFASAAGMVSLLS